MVFDITSRALEIFFGSRNLEIEENVQPNECDSPFTIDETRSIQILTITFATLSVIGSGWIIFSYWYFPRLRTFPYKLVAYLSVANLFSSIGYYVGGLGDEAGEDCNSEVGCIVSAFMTQFFDVANFLWTAIIAFNIYMVFCKNKGRTVENYERYYHLTSWGGSLLLAIIPFFFNAYGDAGIWCWIVAEERLLRFFCYYLPLLLVMGFNIIICLIVMRAVRDSSQESRVNFRLRLYVFVFIFVRIWSIIDRLQNAVSDEPVFAIALLHSMFSPMQGIANALVYGCNYQVIQQYRYCCGRVRNRYSDDTERLDDTATLNSIVVN